MYNSDNRIKQDSCNKKLGRNRKHSISFYMITASLLSKLFLKFYNDWQHKIDFILIKTSSCFKKCTFCAIPKRNTVNVGKSR